MTTTDIFDLIYKRFCTEYSDSSRGNCERCPLYRPCAMCECMPNDYWTLPDDKAEQIFKQGLTEALAAYDAQH